MNIVKELQMLITCCLNAVNVEIHFCQSTTMAHISTVSIAIQHLMISKKKK